MKITSVHKRMTFKALLTITLLAFLVWPVRKARTQGETSQACPTGSIPAQVAFTLMTETGEFPSDIKKEDLSLKVNGNLTKFSNLQRQVGSPLDLALLIDVSVSQEESIETTKRAAQGVIQGLLDPVKDKVALISFAHDIDVEQSLTSDVSKVLAALDAVKVTLPPGYVGGGVVIRRAPSVSSTHPVSTSLWDISTRAMERVYDTAPVQNRKRAMILLTDGEDTSSRGRLSTTIASALQRDVAIYSIGVAGRSFTLNRDSLKKLSEQTGGTAAFPKKEEGLKLALLEIGERLRSQYVISFCRIASEPRPLKVQLDVTKPRFRNTRLAYPREVN